MDFKEMFKHAWRVWFNHGFGQTTVHAPDADTARKEAVAWCRKQQALVDTRDINDLVKKVEMI